MHSLLKKVLWKKASRWQLVGASAGVCIGLFLLLLAIQFYTDMQVLLKGAKSDNILVINKKLSVLNTLGASSSLSTEEIEEVKSQPFVKSVGVFGSNRFQAALTIPSFNLYTLLFFQTVPNQFLGIKDTSGFRWKEGESVPVVLSSDYMALYNYGFAPSQRLPQLTLSTVQKVAPNLELIISGNGKQTKLKAHLHDLSPNINSILVPDAFMEYANSNFGDQNRPSNQLVLFVDNPYSSELNQFLKEKNYEISRGGLIGGELKSVLDMLIVFVAGIALIILCLSLLVFVLNFQLLVAQARNEIQLLLQIGYTEKSISGILSARLVYLFGIVAAIAFGLLVPVKYFLSQSLATQGYSNLGNFPSPIVWIAGLVFCLLLILVNIKTIQKSISMNS